MTAPTDTAEQTRDVTAFRAAMAHMPTFVTVVSTQTGEGPTGCTANAVLSLSLEPPSLVVSLASSSRTVHRIRHGGGFSVSLLSWEQRDLTQRFARGRPDERFAGVPHTYQEGQPVLSDAAAGFVCRVESCQEMWDHTLVVGQVLHSTHHRERVPVVYHGHAQHPCPPGG
ncbi:flavin reductase family protein [Streptomyces sp. TRM 70351]|uniref:flavin reductase family protein n=1 Tax=Streptomyces sp. TRM 70351 TaxID=3116552 RepID=UPI002E7AE8C5|nr:flavin reductase family protein [Streptomyces sp. TRM 70351]MEE1927861.1 flavin reductase family protein [Streptomyces sp. TRM 70351]